MSISAYRLKVGKPSRNGQILEQCVDLSHRIDLKSRNFKRTHLYQEWKVSETGKQNIDPVLGLRDGNGGRGISAKPGWAMGRWWWLRRPRRHRRRCPSAAGGGARSQELEQARSRRHLPQHHNIMDRWEEKRFGFPNGVGGMGFAFHVTPS